MRHPCAIEPVVGLALLVLLDLRQRHAVDIGVAARRDERGHATHRVCAAEVAGLDQQIGVVAHERHGHRHLCAVGQHEPRPVAELLDDAEDVVPPPRVEAARVLTKLVEDLLHLESGEDRLDENGRPDRASRDVELVLRKVEDVVPQPSLEVALQLRQIEVRA